MTASHKSQREVMRCVSHQQATQLLHNKFVVVLGDSIQRSVYKDIVLLLQKNAFLSLQQLKSKGEMSFESDCLVEGGCLGELHNGTQYREVRQYQSANHLVRFYFVTRIYSCYMQTILKDFRRGLKPDVLIINSCAWDISRYNSSWAEDYRDNLNNFFEQLTEILPKETLVIWSLAMPLSDQIKGGFLVPEIRHKAPQLCSDVIEANFFSATLADAYGFDVLDFHFQFRSALTHRTKDGIHWNAVAHRRITSMLLEHAAQAWGVEMLCSITTMVNNDLSVKKPSRGKAVKPAERRPPPRKYPCFRGEGLYAHPQNYSFGNPHPRPWYGRGFMPPPPPPPPPPYSPMHRWFSHGPGWHGYDNQTHFQPRPYDHHLHLSRRSRRHAPYTFRPNNNSSYKSYY